MEINESTTSLNYSTLMHTIHFYVNIEKLESTEYLAQVVNMTKRH